MTKAHTVNPRTVTKRSKCSFLIAKCAAPFAAKQRSQFEQEIRLDEPFRLYAPGDSVKGAIHLNFSKPLRITHLAIRLHGFVKVFSRAKLPGEEITHDENLLASGKGRGRRGTEYFGNGYARLFEDEDVLCGEGCVHGQYDFRFEMVLPVKNMPSSIDFEHGTVSYLMTSTVTRPTAITPTSVQHFKLHVQETIDIARIQMPKPVALSMEASHKKRKPKTASKKNPKLPRSERTSKSSSSNSSSGMPAVPMSPNDLEEPPRSPVPSEISSTTTTTSSTSSNQIGQGETPSYTVNSPTEDIMTVSDPNVILAKTELLQGGCLAGDPLPIRVSIKHNRPIKSMQGVIITLYRQGRIDTHPAIPLGPWRRGEKRRYEDYYPKSRTGLGGLSLSSAGSSRSFRQDLNQIVVPLLVDPQSLTAVINTSIHAPADLFPSMTNAPGEMVSFKYFVEIVVDLRGKLSGQDRLRPHLSMTSTPQHGYGDPRVSRCEGQDGVSYLSTPGFSYIITDYHRRTKGIISTKTEVVVGTRDSLRKRGKTSEERPKLSVDRSLRSSVDLGREEEPEDVNLNNQHCDSILEIQEEEQRLSNGTGYHRTAVIPPPEPEEELDEKGLMRRAEQRLLPSEPPQDDDGPSFPTAPLPSAPPAIDEEDFIRRYGLRNPAPVYDGPSTNNAQTMPISPVFYSGSGGAGVSHANAQDDKQEIERERLLALVSSPDSNEGEADVAGHTLRAIAPSAPILFEDDIFDINDPRVPMSSPNDFFDDRITSENQLPSPKASAPINTEENSHDNHDSHEHDSSLDHGMHDTYDNHDSYSQSEVSEHDENLPVYRR